METEAVQTVIFSFLFGGFYAGCSRIVILAVYDFTMWWLEIASRAFRILTRTIRQGRTFD